MPAYGSSDIVHTASTDHRILRDPSREALRPADAPPDLAARLWPGVPVVPFRRKQADPRDPELLRDLGIGLVMLASKGKVDPNLYADHAASLLDAALARDPGDVEAWVARGHAMMLRNRRAGALTAFEAALQKSPEREDALILAATLAQSFGQIDTATAHWRRAVKLNPYMADYRASLAGLLAAREEWDQVRPQAEVWLRLAPDSVPARRMWISCLLRAGDRVTARAEFRKIEALKPPDLEALRKWFDEQGGR
jgi:tetratricopeptide (TPR) repeat protein